MTAHRLMGMGYGAGPGREPTNGLLNMPSLQSTLHTRPPAQAAQPAPVQATLGQGPEPMMVRSPSLDTWGGPSAGGHRAVDAQALSGFHSGSWVRLQHSLYETCMSGMQKCLERIL